MKNEKDVFVILTPGFPLNENEDACLPFLQHLVKAINKSFPGISVFILAFQYPFKAQAYKWNNNAVVSFGGRNRGKLSRRILWIRVWRKLYQLNRTSTITGILSIWLGECAFVGKHFGEKYNIPHKTWLLGQDAKRGNKYVTRMKPAPHDLVAVSYFIANTFFSNYLIRPEKIIPNGIDTTQFRITFSERTIDVIGAGSLISLKQYHLFIGIIKELKKKYPRIISCIAGQGPEKESLQSLLTNMELEDNISLPGEVDHKNLLGLMQQSKIFLHPSSYEGLSMACLEALYAGCHVISFCKPMEEDIAHWHVVTTKEEMLEKAIEILSSTSLDHTPVLPYRAQDTAASIMKLFRYNIFANIIEPISDRLKRE